MVRYVHHAGRRERDGAAVVTVWDGGATTAGRARHVWLWPADDVLPEEEAWNYSRHLTDVVARYAKPKVGSILIGIGSRGYPGERDAAFVVGIVKSFQPVATYKDRLRIEPILTFAAVPLDRLMPGLYTRPNESPSTGSEGEGEGRRFARPPWEDSDGLAPWHERPTTIITRPRPLQPSLGSTVVKNLSALVPEFVEFMASVELSGRSTTGLRGGQMREERDAIALAADLADIEIPTSHLAAAARPGAPLTSFIDPAFLVETEDDLLAEDLRRFDAFGSLTMHNSAVARFVDKGFRLTIVNVNRKPLEHVLGVDLVYLDEVEQSFTLVQYKRLTRHTLPRGESVGERWKYTRQADLLRQIDLMDLGTTGETSSSADWRMVSTPFWFKFVRDEPFRPDDQTVLKGMYVPAEYLKTAIADGSLTTGPQKGFEVTYSNTRYITRSTFVDLTRRRFLGSSGAASARVREIIQTLGEQREVVLSVKQKAARK